MRFLFSDDVVGSQDSPIKLSMHRTIVTFIDEVDRGGEEGGQDRPWKRTSGNLKNVRCNELPPS